jgi:hypothetical protein
MANMSPTTPFAVWLRHHLPHGLFCPSSRLVILTEIAYFCWFLLLMQAVLAGLPLLRLRGGRSRVGKPLQSIQLRRAGLPISFSSFVLLLWVFGHVFASLE